MSTNELPLLATPTMARLYLAQGHLDQARAIADILGRAGRRVQDVVEAVRKSDEEREVVLSSLLVRVRERRRSQGSGI